MMKKAGFIILMLLIFLPAVGAAEDVGLIVALKGRALIIRDTKTVNAVLKDRIFIRDTVETKAESRTKMLFRDDSILTLAENSKVIIKEYLSAEDKKRGKSIFTLMDGKLRSLVGGNEFEVHTPTVVVAARGTYFITWTGIEEGVPVSGVAVLEGIVDVYNINPAIAGVVKLERGTMSKVFENKPPAQPVPIPNALLKELLDTTELQSMPEAEKKPILDERKPLLKQIAPVLIKEKIPLLPPIESQIPPNRTPVHIRIPIPEGL